MSLTCKMVFSIFLGVFIVASSFTFIQVNEEKHRIQADLERRSITLAESLKESIIPAIESQSIPKLNRLVEKFGNRERLKGIAIFDVSGNIISSTTYLKSVLTSHLTEAVNTIIDKSSNSKFIKVKDEKFYLYSTPLFSESKGEEKLIGVLTLFQDASFIDIRIKDVWKHNLIRLFFLALAISIITLLIINWTIKSPISQIAEWLRAVRTNSATAATPPIRGDILAPHIQEVENITKTISNIKLSEEENLNKQEDNIWNAERLKDFINKKIGEKRLFLASNREPYLHIKDGEILDVLCQQAVWLLLLIL